jgi:endonuclease/exonuclease/phosphatase family metal-dependent hydrolase
MATGMHGPVVPAAAQVSAFCWQASFLVAAAARVAAAPFLPPAIDGDLRDWDVPPNSVVGLTACEERIYLRISLPEAVVLQDNSGVIIYYDTDDNPSTGLSAHGLGAEIRWLAGLRSGTAYTTGPGGLTSRSIRHPDLELRAAPVLDSTDFEVSIRRPAASGGTCRVAVEWSGQLRGVATAVYRNERMVRSLSPARAPHTDLRVMAYNVETDDLLDRADKKDRFLAEFVALQPDVICFTEVYAHNAATTRARVAEALPYMLHASGDGSADSRIVSRYPIVFSEPAGSFHAARVRSEDGSIDVMVITAHLRCCSSDDIRSVQLASIADFVTRMRAGQLAGVPVGLPVILAGDLNLVRRDTPAFLALQQSTGLRPLPALHLDALDDYTWRSDGSTYSPGRLDYILAGPGMVARRAFVFKSATPPSDHLPLVADLAVDQDSNGLGDLWEHHHFGRTGLDSAADPDGDGFSTADEQRAGTHPLFRGDAPRLVAEAASSGFRLRMTGYREGGTDLKLWRSADLAVWEPVPGRWRPDGTALPVSAQGPATFFRATLAAD